MSITAAEIARAADLLHDVVAPTPLEYSRWLSDLVGGDVFLKCENLQRTGSFKLRGAYVRMARLSKKERARGVVAASAGNHAQGVALAAQLLGIKATVFMPYGAPIPKEKATRAYGADIRFVGTSIDDCLAAARAFEAETGAILIHPFDHRDIVAGQATTGLEIVEQCPQVRTVVVPTGGGGLIAGIALAMQRDGMPIEVVGVQAKGAAAYPASLAAGEPLQLDKMATMADGIAVGLPGAGPVRGDPAACRRGAHGRRELVVEGTLAGARTRQAGGRAGRRGGGCRGTGRPEAVQAAGRRGAVRWQHRPAAADAGDPARHGGSRPVPVPAGPHPRHPGRAGDAADPARRGGRQLIEVVHERISETLNLDEVEVALQLETRGEEHRERVLASLSTNGYTYTLN